MTSANSKTTNSLENARKMASIVQFSLWGSQIIQIIVNPITNQGRIIAEFRLR